MTGATARATAGRRRLAGVVMLVVVLVVQAAWSFATRPEPYLSVRLPSFGAAATSDGAFPKRTVTVSVAHEDGAVSRLEMDELMVGFAPRSVRPSLEWAFSDDGSGTLSPAQASAQDWLADRAVELAGAGAPPVALVLRTCEADIDIRAVRTDDRECATERIDLTGAGA